MANKLQQSKSSANPSPGTGSVKKYNSLDSNSFKKEDEIGRGGFGIVYKIKVREGSKWMDAVVKEIHCDDPKEQESIESELLKELENLKRLDHPNVIKMMGYCDNPLGIILEYMVNGSLQDKLADDSRPLTCEERLNIAYKCALALDYLHSKAPKKSRMVHVDFKSANVLLDENFEPKIADMASMKKGYGPFSEPIETEQMICTRIYLAPEGYSRKLTIKLDTYSFGVVLLEMISGLPPKTVASKYLAYNGDLPCFLRPVDDPKHSSLTTDDLDPNATWNLSAAQRLYAIAKCCLTLSEYERPTISEILKDLENLKNTPKEIPQRVCNSPRRPASARRCSSGPKFADILLMSALGYVAGFAIAAAATAADSNKTSKRKRK